MGEQLLRQQRSIHARVIDPRQQEVRLAEFNFQSWYRAQFGEEVLALPADVGARSRDEFAIAQSGCADHLCESVDAPGRLKLEQSLYQARVAYSATGAQARDGKNLGE